MDEFKSEVLAKEFFYSNKHHNQAVNQKLDISDLESFNTNVGNNNYN